MAIRLTGIDVDIPGGCCLASKVVAPDSGGRLGARGGAGSEAQSRWLPISEEQATQRRCFLSALTSILPQQLPFRLDLIVAVRSAAAHLLVCLTHLLHRFIAIASARFADISAAFKLFSSSVP